MSRRLPRTAEDLARLDAGVNQRVLAAVDRLASDPRGVDLRKLNGGHGRGWAVGDWRAIVELEIASRPIVISGYCLVAARMTGHTQPTQLHQLVPVRAAGSDVLAHRVVPADALAVLPPPCRRTACIRRACPVSLGGSYRLERAASNTA